MAVVVADTVVGVHVVLHVVVAVAVADTVNTVDVVVIVDVLVDMVVNVDVVVVCVMMCLVVQRVIFRVLQPLTTVDVKTRPIFDIQNNYWKLKNNSPKFFDVCPGGSQKPQLDIEKDQIHRNTL